MEGSPEESSATPVLESTETDGATVILENGSMTDEQWRAIKAMVTTLLNYRDAKYVVIIPT